MKLVLDEGVQAEDFSIPRIGALFETMMESYQSRNVGDFLEEVLRNRHYKDEAYSNFLMQVMDEGDLIRNTSLTFHARVLENPTCRWSTWDALKSGEKPREDLPSTIQERAWSSPIWYIPNNEGITTGNILPDDI